MSIESVTLSNHLILGHSLLFLSSIFSSIRVLSNELAFLIRCRKYWSFSFNISPSNEHPGLISFRTDWFDLLAIQGDSQESSPASQFKSINSLVLSLLYGPTLTSIHDNWRNHSFDCIDLSWQSDVSAFEHVVYVCHSFPSREQSSFNFMAAIIVHIDLGVQKNKICHCFHSFPIYLPWSDGTRCHDLSFLNVEF